MGNQEVPIPPYADVRVAMEVWITHLPHPRFEKGSFRSGTVQTIPARITQWVDDSDAGVPLVALIFPVAAVTLADSRE